MSKKLISEYLREHAGLTVAGSIQVTNGLLDAIVSEIQKGRFNVPGFGTFIVKQLPARKALNPRTGEKIRVKASRTIKFKPSLTIRPKLAPKRGRKPGGKNFENELRV